MPTPTSAADRQPRQYDRKSFESDEPTLVVWSSIWPKRSDAVIRFNLPPRGGGTNLRWTLSVEEPIPNEALLGHLRKRMNQLINAELRYSFGQ